MKDRHETLKAEIERRLSAQTGVEIRLEDFETESSKPVWCAAALDGSRYFVKETSETKARRLKKTADELDIPLVAKIPWVVPLGGGRAAVCAEWQSGTHVPPERMNAAQTESLLAALASFRAALRPEHVVCPPSDTAGCYTTVSDFAARHPSARFFLNPLLSIPEEDRAAPSTLPPGHGDFHHMNYLFEGDRVSAVLDLESIAPSAPETEFAYCFARRHSKAKLTRGERENLDRRLRQVAEALPCTAADWRRAINTWRLFFAARRLERHPLFAPVAFLVWKHDRRVR